MALQEVTRPSGGTLERYSSSARDDFDCFIPDGISFTCVVLGASGDLAKKKTLPALWALYARGFLPARCRIVGFARSALSSQAFRELVRAHIKAADDPDMLERFLNCCSYVSGDYSKLEGFQQLEQSMVSFEGPKHCEQKAIVGRQGRRSRNKPARRQHARARLGWSGASFGWGALGSRLCALRCAASSS